MGHLEADRLMSRQPAAIPTYPNGAPIPTCEEAWREDVLARNAQVTGLQQCIVLFGFEGGHEAASKASLVQGNVQGGGRGRQRRRQCIYRQRLRQFNFRQKQKSKNSVYIAAQDLECWASEPEGLSRADWMFALSRGRQSAKRARR